MGFSPSPTHLPPASFIFNLSPLKVGTFPPNYNSVFCPLFLFAYPFPFPTHQRRPIFFSLFNVLPPKLFDPFFLPRTVTCTSRQRVLSSPQARRFGFPFVLRPPHLNRAPVTRSFMLFSWPKLFHFAALLFALSQMKLISTRLVVERAPSPNALFPQIGPPSYMQRSLTSFHLLALNPLK